MRTDRRLPLRKEGVFSTYIFEERDVVRAVKVYVETGWFWHRWGSNPNGNRWDGWMKDSARPRVPVAFRFNCNSGHNRKEWLRLARYLRHNPDRQIWIRAAKEAKRIPVDHLQGAVAGVLFRMDFTGFGTFLKLNPAKPAWREYPDKALAMRAVLSPSPRGTGRKVRRQTKFGG